MYDNPPNEDGSSETDATTLEELGVQFSDGPFPAEYMYSRAGWGVWRRSVDEHNRWFAEFKSYWSLFGYPLIHVTYGICPSYKMRIIARGWLAIGRLAMGGLAIGHASLGLIGIGQAGFGILFGLGQATSGMVCLGQLALGGVVGLGQVATGQVAVGQLAAGEYVLAQFGIGKHVWDMRGADVQARQFFTLVAQQLGF